MIEREIHPELPKSRDLGLRMNESSVSWRGISLRPQQNEVAYNVRNGMAVVVDGEMHSFARSSAQVAVDRLATPLAQIYPEGPVHVADQMVEIFGNTHEAIRKHVPGGKASATALTIVASDTERVAVIGSIGTTRAYLLHDGALEQITQDHGVRVIQKPERDGQTVEERVLGEIEVIETCEEVRLFGEKKFGTLPGSFFWDKRHEVSKTLGGKLSDGKPQITTVPVEAGDRLLLTTPGVQNLSRKQIEKILNADTATPAHDIVASAHWSAREGAARSHVVDASAIVIDVAPRIVEHPVTKGGEFTVAYEGTPVTMNIADGPSYSVGRLQDLGYQQGEEDVYLVIDTAAVVDVDVAGRYSYLYPKDFKFAGTEEGAWQLHKGERRSSVKISRDGNDIKFTDLHTQKGMTVSYTTDK